MLFNIWIANKGSYQGPVREGDHSWDLAIPQPLGKAVDTAEVERLRLGGDVQIASQVAGDGAGPYSLHLLSLEASRDKWEAMYGFNAPAKYMATERQVKSSEWATFSI